MAIDLKQLIKDRKAQQAVKVVIPVVKEPSKGEYIAINMSNSEILGLGGSINEALENLYDFLVYLKEREHPNMEPLKVIQTKSWERFGLKIVKLDSPEKLEFTFIPNK